MALLVLLIAEVQAQDFTYSINNGTISITGYTGPSGVATIPATITGLTVTSLADFAFSSSVLTSVAIPNTVTTISQFAFSGCTNLTNVAIPNSVTYIGDSAFSGCTRLTNVTINGGATIAQYAFSGCSTLTSVTFPKSGAAIWDFAFSGCTNLASVAIPNSVIYIGDGAFYDCTALTSVYFTGNAPYVSSGAAFQPKPATVYYLPGTIGWLSTFSGAPTALWTLPYPLILNSSNGNTNLGVQNQQFGFTISWATNTPVVVEASPTLINSAWTPVSTNFLNTGVSYFSDPQWTNYASRFYRIRSP